VEVKKKNISHEFVVDVLRLTAAGSESECQTRRRVVNFFITFQIMNNK
jgi:hypothetical protein